MCGGQLKKFRVRKRKKLICRPIPKGFLPKYKEREKGGENLGENTERAFNKTLIACNDFHI